MYILILIRSNASAKKCYIPSSQLSDYMRKKHNEKQRTQRKKVQIEAQLVSGEKRLTGFADLFFSPVLKATFYIQHELIKHFSIVGNW